MPKLEDTDEKSQLMIKTNYKDHFNQILELKLRNYKRRIIKENKRDIRNII
jgi:hypothetical protein